MRVLVAYASRHGATRGIAERIAHSLSAAGFDVTLQPASQAVAVEEFDAVVVGSAAYMLHWLKDAAEFARRNEAALAKRPTWLFSSGPLGTDKRDSKGRDVLDTSRPREFDELARRIQPRGEQVFFGAWDPQDSGVGWLERIMKRLPGAADALPAGDFRDWPAIDAWAAQIAAELVSA